MTKLKEIEVTLVCSPNSGVQVRQPDGSIRDYFGGETLKCDPYTASNLVQRGKAVLGRVEKKAAAR